MKALFKIFLALGIGHWAFGIAAAQPSFPTNIVVTLNQRGQVSLAWDRAASHTNVTFTVLIGVRSGIYNVRQDADTNATATITNLAPALYYFAVIAKSTAGLESDPSNEISFEVTKPVSVPILRTVGISARLESAQFPSGPWVDSVVFETKHFAANDSQRFFRLRVTAMPGIELQP